MRSNSSILCLQAPLSTSAAVEMSKGQFMKWSGHLLSVLLSESERLLPTVLVLGGLALGRSLDYTRVVLAVFNCPALRLINGNVFED